MSFWSASFFLFYFFVPKRARFRPTKNNHTTQRASLPSCESILSLCISHLEHRAVVRLAQIGRARRQVEARARARGRVHQRRQQVEPLRLQQEVDGLGLGVVGHVVGGDLGERRLKRGGLFRVCGVF